MSWNGTFHSEAGNQDQHVQDLTLHDAASCQRKRMRNPEVAVQEPTADLTPGPGVSRTINGESRQHSHDESNAARPEMGTGRKRKRTMLTTHQHEGDGGSASSIQASAAVAQHGDGAPIDGKHHDVLMSPSEADSVPAATSLHGNQVQNSAAVEAAASAPQSAAEPYIVARKRPSRQPDAACSSGPKRVRFAESKQLEVKVPHQPSASKAEIPDALFSSTPGATGGSSSRMHASQACAAEPAAIALSAADELPEAVRGSLSMQRARELSLARLAAIPVPMASVPSAFGMVAQSHRTEMRYSLDEILDTGDDHWAMTMDLILHHDASRSPLNAPAVLGDLDQVVHITGPLPDWLAESSSRPHVPGVSSGPLISQPNLETDDSSTPWGGLLSALSDTTGDISSLPSEHRLHRLQALIDQLDIASMRSFQDFCGRVGSAPLTQDNVNYLNSPLLDGLYAAYHGRRITDSASQSTSIYTYTVSAPPNLRTALIRASSLTPSLAPDAFRFLMRLNEARELAATDYNAILEAVCEAYRHGHSLHGAQVVLDASTYALPVLERCLASACASGCLGLLKLLLKVAVSSHGAQRLLRTVEAATVEGRIEFLQAVLEAGAVTYRALCAALCATLRRGDQQRADWLWSVCPAWAAQRNAQELVLAASQSRCRGVLEPILQAVKSSLTTPIMNRCIIDALQGENELNLSALFSFCSSASIDFNIDFAARAAVRSSSLEIADLILSHCVRNAFNPNSARDYLRLAAGYGSDRVVHFVAQRMCDGGWRDQFAGAIAEGMKASDSEVLRSLLLNDDNAVVRAVQDSHQRILEQVFASWAGPADKSKSKLLRDLFQYLDRHRVAVDFVFVLEAAATSNCGTGVKALVTLGQLQSQQSRKALLTAIQSRRWDSVAELTMGFAQNRSSGIIKKIVNQTIYLSAFSWTQLLQAAADCLSVWPQLARALFERGTQSRSGAIAEAVCRSRAVVQQLSATDVLTTAHAMLLKQPRAVELLLSSYVSYMAPCPSLNELLVRAVRGSVVGVVRGVVGMQVDLHTDNNAPLRTACGAFDWPCLDALLHRRHQPHSIAAPRTAGSSCDMFAPLEMVPCNCTLMSGPRYMTELLWADAGRVDRLASSFIVPSLLRQVTQCACSLTGCESWTASLAPSTRPLDSASGHNAVELRSLDDYILAMVRRRNWLAIDLCLRDSTGHLRPFIRSALPALMTRTAAGVFGAFLAFKAHVMRLEAAPMPVQPFNQARLMALQYPSYREPRQHWIPDSPRIHDPPTLFSGDYPSSHTAASACLQRHAAGCGDNHMSEPFHEPVGFSAFNSDCTSASTTMDMSNSSAVPIAVRAWTPTGDPRSMSIMSLLAGAHEDASAAQPVVSSAVEVDLLAQNQAQPSTGDSRSMQPLPLGERADIVISARGNLTLAIRS